MLTHRFDTQSRGVTMKKPDWFFTHFWLLWWQGGGCGIDMWSPLYCHTKFHSREAVSFTVTRVRGRSCVGVVISAFTASTDSNLDPVSTDLTFGKRKKSNGDVQSLECCFSPNNTQQIVHCPDEGSLRHSSTSLVSSHHTHVHGGPSIHFIINLIDSLTFTHPINVDNPPDIKIKGTGTSHILSCI